MAVLLSAASAWAQTSPPTAAIIDVKMDEPPSKSLARRGPIDIVSDGSDEEVRLYILARLEDALDKYRAMRVVRSGTALEALRKVEPTADQDPRIAQAKQKLETARKAINQLDAAKAEKLLLEAESLFTDAAGSLSTHAELLEVYLLLGNVYLGLGRSAAAAEVFGRAARLDPRFIPDPAKHPPQVVRQLRIKQAAMRRAGLGRLQIMSKPPGQSFVDGRFLGTTPVTVRSLSPGSHIVSVRRPGFRTWTATVDVPTYKPVRVEAEMPPRSHPQWTLGFQDDRGKAVDAFGAPITDYYRVAAESIGANLLVYGWVKKDEIELRAWRPGTGLSKTVSGPTQEADEVLHELIVMLEDSGQIPGGIAKSSPLGAPRVRPKKTRVRATVLAGQAVAPTDGNFPGGTAIDLDAQLPWAFNSFLEVFATLGVHTNYEARMILRDGVGAPILPTDDRFTGLYFGFPVGAGVGFRPIRSLQWNPYVQVMGFAEPGTIHYFDPLPDDEVTTSFGFGFGAQAAVGVDRILTERLALRVEGRYALRFLGSRDANVDIGLTPEKPDFTLPVDGNGTHTLGLSVGILFQTR